MRWKCPHCGAYNTAARTKCSYCEKGNGLHEQNSQEQDSPRPGSFPGSLSNTVKIILILSIILSIISYLNRNKLPDKKDILPQLYQAPVQTATKEQPFSLKKKDINYTITPLYAYELHGLVVSHHDARVWWDIYHREWQDYLNTKDLLVIWGKNISSEIYKHIKFSNTSFFGHARWKSGTTSEIAAKFDYESWSNNHVLPGNPLVAKYIMETNPGDQIYLKGLLVKYDGPNVQRSSSTTRSDTGGGACETIYIQEYKILKKANQSWRIIFVFSKYSIILSMLVLIIKLFKV